MSQPVIPEDAPPVSEISEAWVMKALEAGSPAKGVDMAPAAERIADDLQVEVEQASVNGHSLEWVAQAVDREGHRRLWCRGSCRTCERKVQIEYDMAGRLVKGDGNIDRGQCTPPQEGKTTTVKV